MKCKHDLLDLQYRCIACGTWLSLIPKLEVDEVIERMKGERLQKMSSTLNVGRCAEHGDYTATLDGKPTSVCSKCPTLQLLVIDLGDSCVVKVEKGDMSEKGVIARMCYYVSGIERARVGDTIVFDMPFRDVQDAINRHFADGEKPVPRIEYTPDSPTLPNFTLHVAEKNGTPPLRLGQVDIDALSELAGHPLPVWKAKAGKWEELTSKDNPCHSEIPVAIWRYTQ